MKLVYVFSKKGRLRFVSHLDLQRFLMRALNRTCLPIAFSQGFNPHPLLSIAGALAMGYDSDYEVFEVKIDKEIDLQTALATMQAALPEDEARQLSFAHFACLHGRLRDKTSERSGNTLQSGRDLFADDVLHGHTQEQIR